MPLKSSAAALVAVLAAVVSAAAPVRAAEDVGYLAATCSGCHRPGAEGAIPGLDGLAAPRLAEALRAFRDGTRPDRVMAAVTAGLDDATLAALADHLAARP